MNAILRRRTWRRLVLLFSLCAVPAVAQTGGDRVVDITFDGLGRTNVTYVQDIVSVRVGDRVTPADLDGAVERLLRTGRFLTARYERVPADGGVRIRFVVAERSSISALTFEGNSKFSDRKLGEVIGIKVGDPVDMFAIRGGQDAIRSLYRESGYSEASAQFDRDRLEQTGELVYRIEEGVRVRVRKIEFEGNTVFPKRQLMAQIVTRPAFPIFVPGDYDEDRVEADVSSIQRFYRDFGYLDARVGFRRDLSDDGEDLTLTFTIAEGTQYSVERVSVEGNSALSTGEILDMIETEAGQPVRQPSIDGDVEAIRSKYWELGYIYVSVNADRVFSETPDLASVIFRIDEGDQYKVGRVIVRGNARTRDKVVRRALNLYPPDDLFDLNEAREAEKRLRQTQIFEQVNVYPIGDDPDRRDAVMDVQVAERRDAVVFGVGVTSNSGLVGTLLLDLKNFDITDTPRSWEEFWRFRSFFGGGQRLRIELQPGTVVNRFRIDFTEPYLFDRPLRFDMGAYLFERGRDGYDEQRVGSTVAFGKRFEKGFLYGWSGEIALRAETVDVDDVGLFAAREIKEDRGSNFLTSVKLSLVRDRTDSFFLPTEGDRLRMSYEQFGMFGGDHTFGRVFGSYAWYKTLRVDKLDRKSVLRLSGEGGVIVGEAPVFERFYAGGTGSMRGFQFRGIGEREGLTDNNIGGDYLVLLGAEYSFPLFAENVRGHVFLDTGTAGAGAYRASVGAGIRIILDLFGPIPLEFNLAAPVARDTDDEEEVFSFLIGTLF